MPIVPLNVVRTKCMTTRYQYYSLFDVFIILYLFIYIFTSIYEYIIFIYIHMYSEEQLRIQHV